MNHFKNEKPITDFRSMYQNILKGLAFMDTYRDGNAECFVWSMIARLLEKTSIPVDKGIELIEGFKSFATDESPNPVMISCSECGKDGVPDMSYFYPGENGLYASLSEEENVHSLLSCDPETSWERYTCREALQERIEAFTLFHELFSTGVSPAIGSAWILLADSLAEKDTDSEETAVVNALRGLEAPLLSYAREWFISQSVDQKLLTGTYEDICQEIEETIVYLQHRKQSRSTGTEPPFK